MDYITLYPVIGKVDTSCACKLYLNHTHIDEALDVKVSWEVSYTWERWKDLNRVLEYHASHSLEELPVFPKDHLVMTTLLIDDRLNGLTRLQ